MHRLNIVVGGLRVKDEIYLMMEVQEPHNQSLHITIEYDALDYLHAYKFICYIFLYCFIIYTF